MTNNKNLNEYFITFGSNHIPYFNGNPMNVMLIIEGDDFFDARLRLLEDKDLTIGNKFAFQYDICEAEDMSKRFTGMRLYKKDEFMRCCNG